MLFLSIPVRPGLFLKSLVDPGFSTVSVTLCGLAIFMGLPVATTQAGEGWTSVRTYLPESWPKNGSEDLHDHIQNALEEESMLFFPGSGEKEDPLVYPTTAGLEVPEGNRVKFAPHARLLRLPSEGHLITLQEGACLTGAVIDGNKYAHWPEFKKLGKSDSGVRLKNRCVIEDCVVFNNPGTAFFSYGSHNRAYRCLAENVGYIDVKFEEDFYQGKWDKWSGDGFYFRGDHNLIKDCEAYDCFRWGYVSSHSGARQNTYVDCKGGDVNWDTYGFIDIEGAEANNRLIRCVSPNSHIAIPGSPLTVVKECVSSSIRIYDAQNPDTVETYGGGALSPRIEGCTTTRGGITMGGYSSRKGKHIPGGLSPIVVGNRMFKSHPDPTDPYSDWSFSVHSIDGKGTVANNVLFEYDGPRGKGPGMNLDNIEGTNNEVVYGQNDLDLAEPKLRYAHVPDGYASVLTREKKERKLMNLRETLYQAPESGESLPNAEGFSMDFPPDENAQKAFIPAYRVGWSSSGGTELRGGGAVITKRRFGPGVYHARFLLDESHPDFAYHSYAFLFYAGDVEKFDGSESVGRRTEYLSLAWDKSGNVTLNYTPSPEEGKHASTYELGTWFQPGPSPETRIKPGEAVDLTMKVPEPGNPLEVYLNQADTRGTPDCSFTMPSRPRSGHFGFLNSKWYSRVRLLKLDYRPLKN